MILYYTKVLNRGFFLLFIFLLSRQAVSDISFKDDGRMYFFLPGKEYRVDGLIIKKYYYINTDGIWFISDGTSLINKLKYATLEVDDHYMIGVKSNVHYLLSIDGTLLAKDLVWVRANKYGVAIKESENTPLKIITVHSELLLYNYDYAIPAASGIIAWNKDNTWYLLGQDGKLIHSSDSRIVYCLGKFILFHDNRIHIIDNENNTDVFLKKKYSIYMNGDEYLYLFNSESERWEIWNENLSLLFELEDGEIPSVSYNGVIVLVNRKSCKYSLMDINKKIKTAIQDCIIGEKYLFVKINNVWNQIY